MGQEERGAAEKAKHTPGPWTLGRLSGERVVMADGESGLIRVADCRDPDEHTEETERANARLIAAAPDLLAALNDACDGYCFHCRTVGENSGQSTCPESPSCGEREQMWWAALAKAVGK